MTTVVAGEKRKSSWNRAYIAADTNHPTQLIGLGNDLRDVTLMADKVMWHYYFPVSRQAENRFNELAAKWKSETKYSSSMTDMILHPAYMRIIGMGKEALPLILRELRREPDYWFWALSAIADAEPVRPEDVGNLEKSTEAWLNWASEEGYLY